ncbi:MAG: phospholipase D/Transphosphatidylase, partial [Rhizobacter sp.]|nr:phospholipase D/Transphosphatidylase [Rhizobacter sp.]
DFSRVFVGSFNFDPRSARLNTELGFVIDSAALAANVESIFDRQLPSDAYAVRLDDHGKVYWTSQEDGNECRFTSEPGTSIFKRFFVKVMERLPIEWLL